MRVSVVVPVRDDPHVDGLLASLDAQLDAPDLEVLMAMDGSGREPRVPAALPARLLRLPPRGPALPAQIVPVRSRNPGSASSDGSNPTPSGAIGYRMAFVWVPSGN